MSSPPPDKSLTIRDTPNSLPVASTSTTPLVVREEIKQLDVRPAQYTTLKSRGTSPQPLPSIKLPSLLSVTIALITATLFLVGASMFSIALTSYSNSVDRYNRQQSNQFLLME